MASAPADGEDGKEPRFIDGDPGTQNRSPICHQSGPWPGLEPPWPGLPGLHATHPPSDE